MEEQIKERAVTKATAFRKRSAQIGTPQSFIRSKFPKRCDLVAKGIVAKAINVSILEVNEKILKTNAVGTIPETFHLVNEKFFRKIGGE